jgi:hypothetical protein
MRGGNSSFCQYGRSGPQYYGGGGGGGGGRASGNGGGGSNSGGSASGHFGSGGRGGRGTVGNGRFQRRTGRLPVLDGPPVEPPIETTWNLNFFAIILESESPIL